MNEYRAAGGKPAAVLIVGGGIAGMRAGLDLADAGLKVYLVEQTPCLGGRVAQLGFMFPQHDCVLCRGTPDHGYGCTRPSISPAYVHHNRHPNIEVLTDTQVVDVAGQAGDFTATLRQEPQYVDPERCVDCGYCEEACTVDIPNPYQLGMTRHRPIHKVATRAMPDAYVLDRGPYCDGCGRCSDACPTQAINLNARPRLMTVEVGAIILAVGFKTFDASSLEEFGFGRFANVLDAMQYERIASRSGPTEGMIFRPSNGRSPRSIAWLQCIGSRDQQNLFCSSICCMYATKEAMLAKQRLGEDVSCSIFIMDERAFNKEYSAYFERARSKHQISYHRCRVSGVHEDPQTKELIVHYPDASGQVRSERFDLLILATGLQPPDSAGRLAEMLGIELNEYGFCTTDKFSPLQTTCPGVFVCGAFASPKEISETIIDASGAAAEVMRLLNDRLNTNHYSREWPFLTSSQMPPEKEPSKDCVRTGFFACTCGKTISRALDVSALSRRAEAWPGVVVSRTLDFACFPETLDRIQETIREHELDRVVIAACSNRTHESLFQRTVREVGINPFLMELVNIRDHCARVHEGHLLADKKAAEMARLAVARVASAKPLHRRTHGSQPAALVIGAGVAGMSSALAIADSGYDVHLVERTEALGGNLRNLYYVAEGYNPQRLLRDLVNRVRSHRRIFTYTRTQVDSHSGHIGDFRARLVTHYPDGKQGSFEVRNGVTIIATGAQESRQHDWLTLPHVLTQRELEEKLLLAPKEIAGLENVVMIQCVQPAGSPSYCSRVCCTNTMKNAVRIKLVNPSCRVVVLYKNIVTYGFREEYYREARQLGVIFSRYTDDRPPEIIIRGSITVVRYYDLALDRWVDLPADLVPLSMAVIPAEGAEQLARMLRLPRSSEGFFSEAQLKLRPMDMSRDGIFLAGMAHYPKFIEESISHGLAAAARALTILSQEKIHLGGMVAVVDPSKCVGCLTCTRVCPFAIPQVVFREGRTGVGGLGGAAFIDESQCHGCGTCTAECPANAIQLLNYTDEQMLLRRERGLGAWQVDMVEDETLQRAL